LKKWLIILGLSVLVLGGVLAVGCSSNETENGDSTTALPLEVTQPEDESIVNTSEVMVKGETTADAVVTVNGILADVDADGRFSATVSLEEGPNVIEVYASDFEGREASEILSVIYVIQQ
jgi:hypothetical protein